MPRVISFLLLALLSCPTQAADTDSLQKILNYYQITENIGIGGQPSADQFSDIAKADYSAVINLAMPDSSNANPEEANIVTSLGMQYIHIPVVWDAPSPDQLREFFQVMDALGNERVFVHCAANYRASAFVYQYLVLRMGIDPDLATSPILRKWLPDMDDNWKSIMELKVDDVGGQ